MSKTRQELLDLIDDLRVTLKGETTKSKPSKPKLPKKEVSRLVAQLKEVTKPFKFTTTVFHDLIIHEFDLPFDTEGDPQYDALWFGNVKEKFSVAADATPRETLIAKEKIEDYRDGVCDSTYVQNVMEKHPEPKIRKKLSKAFDKEIDKLEKTYEIDIDDIDEIKQRAMR